MGNPAYGATGKKMQMLIKTPKVGSYDKCHVFGCSIREDGSCDETVEKRCYNLVKV